MKYTIPSTEFPTNRGAYALWFIFHKSEQEIQVGKRGTLTASGHYYCYLGSAKGPGGLRARIKHHLRPKQRPHWHIDYLFPSIKYQWITWTTEIGDYECIWSQELSRQIFTSIPLAGFGASDCKHGCTAHLYEIQDLTPALLKGKYFAPGVHIDLFPNPPPDLRTYPKIHGNSPS